jgi:hypothetical protein
VDASFHYYVDPDIDRRGAAPSRFADRRFDRLAAASSPDADKKNLIYTAVLTHDGHCPKTFSLHLGETRNPLKKREVFE